MGLSFGSDDPQVGIPKDTAGILPHGGAVRSSSSWRPREGHLKLVGDEQRWLREKKDASQAWDHRAKIIQKQLALASTEVLRKNAQARGIAGTEKMSRSQLVKSIVGSMQKSMHG